MEHTLTSTPSTCPALLHQHISFHPSISSSICQSLPVTLSPSFMVPFNMGKLGSPVWERGEWGLLFLSYKSMKREKTHEHIGDKELVVMMECGGSRHIPVPLPRLASVLGRQVTSVLVQLSFSVCTLSSVIIFSTVLHPIKFAQISHYQEYTHFLAYCSG